MGSLHLTIRGSSQHAPMTLTLHEEKVTFGRYPTCHVQLPFATVSNHHLTFIREPHNYTVTDMGTTNGTIIDGQRIPPHTPIPILRKMQLRIVDVIVDLDPVIHMPPEGFTIAESGTMARKLAAEVLASGPHAQANPAFFEVLSGPGSGKRFTFKDNLEEAWLGNDRANEVYLDDPRIEPRHIRISGNGSGFDLEACPGCSFLVNGRVVTTKHTLRSDDRVIIASAELYFYDPLQEYLDEMASQSDAVDAEHHPQTQAQRAERAGDEAHNPDRKDKRAPMSALDRVMLTMSIFFMVATFVMLVYIFV